MKWQGGAAVHWAEEAAGMDVLGRHGETTSAEGASREAKVSVVASEGEKRVKGLVRGAGGYGQVG